MSTSPTVLVMCPKTAHPERHIADRDRWLGAELVDDDNRGLGHEGDEVDERKPHEPGAALVYLFTTMVYTRALGALLTLSSFVWYPSYLATTKAFGFTALEDQQLGGLVM